MECQMARCFSVIILSVCGVCIVTQYNDEKCRLVGLFQELSQY